MNVSRKQLLVTVVVLLAACGGGSTEPSAAQGVIISVAPSAVTLQPAGSQAFAAAVTGTVNTSVSWSIVEGAAGGTVGSTGNYQAPASTGTYHVVATSLADSTKSATAIVTVATAASGPALLSGFPVSADRANGTSGTFTRTLAAIPSGTRVVMCVSSDGAAGVQQTATVSSPSLTWSLLGRSNDSSAGLGGTAEVWQATAAADVAAGETVTISLPGTWAASASAVAFSGVRQLRYATASGVGVTKQVAVTNTSVGSLVYLCGTDWSQGAATPLSGDVLDHLYSPSGQITAWLEHQVAASAGGNVTVGLTGTGAVNMVGLEVSAIPPPPPPQIASFTASPAAVPTVGGSTTLSWSTSGATTVSIDNGVGAVATAGSMLVQPPGGTTTYTLTASNAGGTQKTSVTVTAPLPVAVSISPTSATVLPSGSQTFTAAVLNAADTSVTWAVQEGTAGGSITSAGVYTAPATEGTYHVVATSVQDPSRSSTATVGVGTSYQLPADRTTVWQPGLNAVGGIPNRTTVCATLTPRGGTLDDTSAIQAAVNACPAGQVVQLGPGTFRVSGEHGVDLKSNVTVRGAGANSTTVTTTSGNKCFYIGTWGFPGSASAWTQQQNLTADAQKGSNTVTVASNPGYVVGELVHVDETYDSSILWYNPARQTTDYLGWGEARAQSWGAGPGRPLGQVMEIAGINGTTLTFTAPFHMPFRTSFSGHVARLTNAVGGSGVITAPIQYAGIESLRCTNATGGDGSGSIVLAGAKYSWVKNVEAFGAGIPLISCFRCVIRDSYIHHGYPAIGGGGYAISVDTYAADNLIENNISQAWNKVLVMRGSGGGNVIGYNYFEDGYSANDLTTLESGMNAAHMVGSHMELFEGNQAYNSDGDATWGNSIYIMYFRNHITAANRRSVNLYDDKAMTGSPVTVTDLHNRRGASMCVNHWWYSYVGNVLGYPANYLQSPAIGHAYAATFSPAPQGTSFQYEWLSGNFPDTQGRVALWQIGYDGNNWVSTPDVVVQQRLLRDGNYDYFTNQVHWHGIGGTGQSNGLTRPAAATLPTSLYLTSKPAFFGSSPWPWVDGSNASSPLPGTLPARMRFDAGTPNG
jgi:uncharacterized repeat protein (TIGR01451 family)